jgi:hypothetical protein
VSQPLLSRGPELHKAAAGRSGSRVLPLVLAPDSMRARQNDCFALESRIMARPADPCQPGHETNHMPPAILPTPAPNLFVPGGMVFREDALSLAQAARKLPSLRGRKPPHPATLYRWATVGRRSRSGRLVRLEVELVGGTNCTSIQALSRFFDRLNDVEPADPPLSPVRADAIRKRQAEEAKTILKQRGLI